MVKDTRSGGLQPTNSNEKQTYDKREEKKETYKDNDSETSSREERVNPRLNLRMLYVETRGDNPRLVEAAVELNNNFIGMTVVDNFELADVA